MVSFWRRYRQFGRNDVVGDTVVTRRNGLAKYLFHLRNHAAWKLPSRREREDQMHASGFAWQLTFHQIA